MRADDAQAGLTMAAGRRAPGWSRRPASALAAAVLLVALVAAACGSDASTPTDGGSDTSADAATTTEPLGPELSVEWTGVRTSSPGLTIAFLGLPPATDPTDPCQAEYRA